MSIVVGVPPDESGSAALALAAILARSADDDLVITTVVPLPWPPRPSAMDAEYREHLQRRGEQTLTRARAELDERIPARFELRQARSSRLASPRRPPSTPPQCWSWDLPPAGRSGGCRWAACSTEFCTVPTCPWPSRPEASAVGVRCA